MNKKDAAKLQRYIDATADRSPESEEVKKLRRTRSDLKFRIQELRTRWKLPKSTFDRETDESMADHLEANALAETEAKLRELGASF